MGALLGPLLTQVVLPELLAYLRGFHQGSGGQLPTDAQIIAEFQAHADRVVSKADAFLASKGVTLP